MDTIQQNYQIAINKIVNESTNRAGSAMHLTNENNYIASYNILHSPKIKMINMQI